MLRAGIGIVAMVVLVALSTAETQGQDWRRQGTYQQPYYQQQYPQYQSNYPGYQSSRQNRQQFRSDPSASSDPYPNQGGTYTDPSASSDPYPGQVAPMDPSGSSDPFNPYPPYIPPYQPPYQPPYYPPIQPQPRKFLGVYAQPTAQGAYVTGVIPGSPAFRVGIEPGDVIYSVDGIQVGYNDLGQILRTSDGYVNLYIRDVRTGQWIQRNVDIR